MSKWANKLDSIRAMISIGLDTDADYREPPAEDDSQEAAA